VKALHRADRTGRSRHGPPFVSVPLYMLECPAWRALSSVGKVAWIEVARLYKGHNNGQLGLSARTLGERINCSKATAARALNELEVKGFIGVQKVGRYGQKDASEYFLTLYRNDVNCDPPTKAFMRWTPPPTVSKKQITVSPMRLTQQNYRPQSHRRDCEGPKKLKVSLTHETHIDSYHGGLQSGTRSAPIGSAVASGPLCPAAEAAAGREKLIDIMVNRHGKSRAEAMAILDAVPDIDPESRNRAS
jgi:hypothetical protein